MTEWSVRREGMTTQSPRVTHSGSAVPNMLGLPARAMKIAIIGASGKLGQYMVEEALARAHEVTAVCREESVPKLARFAGSIRVIPGRTDDRDVIARAVADADGVLTVLAPWGMNHYASGTAQAVLDLSPKGARLVFSSGWNIVRDARDVYSVPVKYRIAGWFARLLRIIDLNDQLEAGRRIFASDAQWTVVRASNLDEGESEGLPVWSRHLGDPLLASNRTRRIDFAQFMVHALENDALVREAPAIVSRMTPSARQRALGDDHAARAGEA